jgi:hypothetical protein
MDLQTIFNNMMVAHREEQMKNSSQLTIVELLLKLQAAGNKDLPVVFDDGTYRPCGLSSWRGSYAELAFTYAKVGEKPETSGCDYNSDEIEKVYPANQYMGEYTVYKQIRTTLPDKPKVSDVVELLKRVQGKTFTGYKSGDFTMGKTTPLWIANYGHSDGFKTNDKFYEQAVIDVLEANDAVSILTELIEY